MTNQVKVFNSTDTGAPILNGTAGSMIALLDACLINGYNLKTATSLTRSGSVATFTVATGHGYINGAVVLIAGANEPEYNGEFVISNVTSTAFNYTLSGTPATPATGTITAKEAPLGFAKAFTGTNKAAYKSVAPGASGLLMRVDDALAQYTRVRGYESMTDVDTGLGPFPTATQLANGLTWQKSSTADATAMAWLLIGDEKLFYLFVLNAAVSKLYSPWAFGDFVSYKAGDAYNCMIIGSAVDAPSAFAISNHFTNCAFGSVGQYIARSYSQLGSALAFGKYGLNGLTDSGASGVAVYPSVVDNGLIVSPVTIGESTAIYRGVFTGVYQCIQNNPLAHGDVVTGITGLSGRSLMMVKAATVVGSEARVAIDITGPWS